jgi:hypothetical protein
MGAALQDSPRDPDFGLARVEIGFLVTAARKGTALTQSNLPIGILAYP